MAHIHGEVTINAPVDEVFDPVADERNEPRYNPRIVRAEKVSEGPVGRGSRFVAEPKNMGLRGQMALDVLEYDRPRSRAVERRNGGEPLIRARPRQHDRPAQAEAHP